MLSVTKKPFIVLKVIMLSGIMLSVIMLSVIMLSVIMLSAIMLSVIMLSVIMLSVIMLNVMSLDKYANISNEECSIKENFDKKKNSSLFVKSFKSMCDKEVHPSHSTSAFRGAATFSMTTLCTTTLAIAVNYATFSNAMVSVAIKSTVTLSKVTLCITINKIWHSE